MRRSFRLSASAAMPLAAVWNAWYVVASDGNTNFWSTSGSSTDAISATWARWSRCACNIRRRSSRFRPVATRTSLLPSFCWRASCSARARRSWRRVTAAMYPGLESGYFRLNSITRAPMFSFLRVFANTNDLLAGAGQRTGAADECEKNGIANEPAHHSLKIDRSEERARRCATVFVVISRMMRDQKSKMIVELDAAGLHASPAVGDAEPAGRDVEPARFDA